jgi:hypothetical protein
MNNGRYFVRNGQSGLKKAATPRTCTCTYLVALHYLHLERVVGIAAERLLKETQARRQVLGRLSGAGSRQVAIRMNGVCTC